MGFGIIMIGLPPTFEEFWRILLFLALGIAYIAFWLNLGILFSVRFKQAATSALASIAVWLFFSLFYQMIVNVLAKGILSADSIKTAADLVDKQGFVLNLMRLSPNYLFTEST